MKALYIVTFLTCIIQNSSAGNGNISEMDRYVFGRINDVKKMLCDIQNPHCDKQTYKRTLKNAAGLLDDIEALVNTYLFGKIEYLRSIATLREKIVVLAAARSMSVTAYV